MENPAIRHQKLLNAYLAASREHSDALLAWWAAPCADKSRLLTIAAKAKIRLDLAHAAWREFRQP
jgi:hypothetical protein